MGRIKASSKADRSDTYLPSVTFWAGWPDAKHEKPCVAIVPLLDLSRNQKSTIRNKYSAAHPFVSVMFEISAETAP